MRLCCHERSLELLVRPNKTADMMKLTIGNKAKILKLDLKSNISEIKPPTTGPTTPPRFIDIRTIPIASPILPGGAMSAAKALLATVIEAQEKPTAIWIGITSTGFLTYERRKVANVVANIPVESTYLLPTLSESQPMTGMKKI
ncbi:MAG: hypothetical protein QXQ11_09700 [Candidatus Bathyarchaeia archaeon]